MPGAPAFAPPIRAVYSSNYSGLGLSARVLEDVPGAHVNGERAERTPNTVNFRFDGADGERVVVLLDREGFAVSTGAACSAGAVEPSHVLAAMGRTPEEVQGSVRVSLGRYMTAEDVDAFASCLSEIVRVERAAPRGDVRRMRV